MSERAELLGKKFGRLTVKGEAEHIKYGGETRPAWLCICDCGKKIIVQGKSLLSKSKQSCGCLAKDSRIKMKFKPRTITCVICGKKYTHTQGNRLKTCSKECHRLRRLKYIHDLSQSNFSYVFKRIEKNTKTRAKKLSLEFNLDINYIEELNIKQDQRCAKTGIAFTLTKGKGLKERSPWSISIDRIDNTKGYIKGNVQLVCLIYNLCKSSWTDKEVLTMSEQLLKKVK